MTLLERYRQTRIAMLAAMGFDSQASHDERLTALRDHHETLRLIEDQHPGITYTHSTAEWHLGGN